MAIMVNRPQMGGGLMSSPLVKGALAVATDGASLLASKNSPVGKAASLYEMGSNAVNAFSGPESGSNQKAYDAAAKNVLGGQDMSNSLGGQAAPIAQPYGSMAPGQAPAPADYSSGYSQDLNPDDKMNAMMRRYQAMPGRGS